MSEIRKVRLGDMSSDELNVYVDDVYNNVKPTHTTKFEEYMYNNEFHKYDWKGLKRSILDGGYDIDKHGPIRVHTNDKEFKYYITDGQHRVFILREIFGDDHMVDVEVRGDKKKVVGKIYEEGRKYRTPYSGRWPFRITSRYIEIINKWLFTGYFLIYHTIPIIFIVTSFFIINRYLPNNEMYKTLKKGSMLSKLSDISKPLYTIALNAINNIQLILYITIILSVTLHVLITDFYGIMIIVILTNLLTYLSSKFKKE